MTTCYLCSTELTSENRSNEHILLNSIGGHLKSKELLCRKCNSNFGHQADSELSKQLSFLSSYLQVKRDNGENPIFKGSKTKDGKEYHIVGGSKPVLSKPTFKKVEENGEAKYSITARNESELLNILKGLRKKHPELDLEAAKQKFQWKEEYLNEFLNHDITIGGDLAFQSLVKTAVNYYILSQGDKEQVKHLFDYLRGTQSINIAKHFYPDKPIYQKDSNEIVHLIHLVGNKYSKLLYCFIELFSSFSFVILLSNKFEGSSFTSTYCYNILKNQRVEKNVTLKLKKELIEEIFRITKNDFATITNKLNRVMDIATKIQTDKEISNIIKKAMDKVLNKYKGEPLFTEQMLREFSEEVSLAFVKFAYRGRRPKVE